MNEYICREYVLEEIDKKIEYINFCSPYQNDNGLIVNGLERARDAVEDAVAANVVEVVRCKDCVHYKRVLGAVGNWCDCDYTPFDVDPDDFCSFGERKVETE